MKSLRNTLLLLFISVTTLVKGQDLSFNMQMSKASDKEAMTMKVYTNKTKMLIQPQITGYKGNMSILIDQSAKKQYMLMNNEGQKMAMIINYVDQVEKMNAVGTVPKITRTGETKTIDGYQCEKVIAETEESKSTMWITKDLGLQYGDLYKIIASGNNGPQSQNANLPAMKEMNGFPIEMEVTNKKKSETAIIRIKNISKEPINAAIFSTEGYQMMDMGNIKK